MTGDRMHIWLFIFELHLVDYIKLLYMSNA